MRILVVVPARGGSRGVARKNLRRVGGDPMTPAGGPLIAWSIRAARELEGDVRVVVSTEDAEIADAARRYGAEVVDRPDVLATDLATTDSVLLHALRAVTEHGWAPELVVLLQPTVPVRRAGLVADAVRRLEETGADSLLTAYPLHFVWWRETPKSSESELAPRSRPPEEQAPAWRSQCPRRPRRQDMQARELMWHEDGSVYVCRAELLERTGARLGGHMEVLETERTVDVDTERDLAVADALLEHAREPVLCARCSHEDVSHWDHVLGGDHLGAIARAEAGLACMARDCECLAFQRYYKFSLITVRGNEVLA